MWQTVKKHRLEILFLLSLNILFLSEDGFLLVPTLQYIMILSYLSILILALISSISISQSQKSFKERFTSNYRKSLFITMTVISVVLWATAFYALLAMKQAKNPYLITFVVLSALLISPTKWHYEASKNVILNTHAGIFVLYTLLVFLFILIAIIWTYQYPNMMLMRCLLTFIFILIYIFTLSMGDWRKRRHENN